MCKNHQINRYDSLTNVSTSVFSFSYERLVTSFAVKDELMLTGGQKGELWFNNLRNGKLVIPMEQIADVDNAIINGITFYSPPQSAVRVLISNNDCFVRNLDLQTFRTIIDYKAPLVGDRAAAPVNYAVASPDGRLILMVGDSDIPEHQYLPPSPLSHRPSVAWLLDAQSGEVVTELKGHMDSCFSASWHPYLPQFVTASQDCTSRVWDARQPSASLHLLAGRIAPIRSVSYSSDGRFLCMAEAADYVHIYDVLADYKAGQTIDFFGEIVGAAFTPDNEGIFTGISDGRYGCIMEHERATKRGGTDWIF